MKNLLLLCIILILTISCSHKPKQKPEDFIPKGYELVEKIEGDLNKDKIPDYVLIVKGNKKSEIFIDDYGKTVDSNRRGIIIVLNKKGSLKMACKNMKCFSSEEYPNHVSMSVNIKKGNLNLHFTNEINAYWDYLFKFRKNDFELIGFQNNYQSSFSSEWVTFEGYSINFLTKKKVTKTVIDVNSDGEEIYNDAWENIKTNPHYKLSKIKDFDELYLYE
jgi:hypothetical protein